MASQHHATSVRKLVDKFFSLQWCRDNLVVPLYIDSGLPMQPKMLKIAIANYSYLGTIAEPIKQRVNQSGENLKCVFEEYSQEEIQEILDHASEERFISDDIVEVSQFNSQSVLEAVKKISSNSKKSFLEYEDEFEENFPEEKSLDLALEMAESDVQNASGALLIMAKIENVSDIHLEPKEECYKIRVRKDGVMQKFLSMPREPGIQLVACLKNMAMMDIAERRESQDGKILRNFEGNRFEFRCSTVSGKHGEKMVLRTLNSDAFNLNLDTLIHIESVREDFRKIMNATNGIVIVSGPTGSGKSTTLAAALREMDNGETNIVTAEDPVEYDMGGDITQVQLNKAKGQTFTSILRTFLRQDPDVILIGETRDPETAESSIDAAETGHLVFTTLHANSSTSSITRLLEMEVPKYKLNASVRGVLAQRLLRKVCSSCAIKRPISEREATEFQISNNTKIMYANTLSAEEKHKRYSEQTLCPQCQGSGYKGRVGAYELLLIDRNIQKAISEGAPDREIENIAVNENSMLTLTQYGLELVKDHLTTLSEVIRVCSSDY